MDELPSRPERADADDLADELAATLAEIRARAADEPFGNPILALALAISRRIDQGKLDLAAIAALVRALRDAAFADRARRLAAYVGGTEAEAAAAFVRLAARLIRPDPADSPLPFAQFQAAITRPRFAAVFTAHPTFVLPPAVAKALAERACGRSTADFESHRAGAPPTLAEEFDQAVAAIGHARDALDALNAALLEAARATWPDRWAALIPAPIVVASWVGYDTDGRTDIQWWDTFRLRLAIKRLQLARLAGQLAPLDVPALAARVIEAEATVAAQIALCPNAADPDQVSRFAHALVDGRTTALTTPAPLLDAFAEAIAAAPSEQALALAVARAGLVSHGLALAHTHLRLNAAQIHNVARLRLGLADPPNDPSRRRVLLAAINAALDQVVAERVDFGGLLAERASAARLMMVAAQIIKHIDGAVPIRFLIAETESGYTLLAALWLARLHGVAERIEICPLFETAEALERGVRVLEEALRSPHWRAYLGAMGRICLQFGYSDSGRFVGQLAASYLIERLRLKIAETLARHGLADLEVVLFDTHGESIGRGAHPGSLAERFDYLSPPASRQALAAAGFRLRQETSFQGGDGYLLFATPELARASIARIAEHTLAPVPETGDPVYAEADFTADFFATIRAAMAELLEDPGYAALLGIFGPALIEPSGSRPAARAEDGLAGPARIRHPRELRAIPNNAILQQVGWCANTLHGLGAALARHPETAEDLRAASPRFRRALDLARHALAHSDIDVLRAVAALFDSGAWLDRAAHARSPAGRRATLLSVARAVERLGQTAPVQRLFRRLQADHLALLGVWPEAPRMAEREVLLHALRLALISRLWLLATEIPDFAPRDGVTRAAIEARILRLDIPASVALLTQIFPPSADPADERDFAEPHDRHTPGGYAREHAEIFAPMATLFALIREIGLALGHEIGAFG
jgi:phosphoenolpyruvate carboxylase